MTDVVTLLADDERERRGPLGVDGAEGALERSRLLPHHTDELTLADAILHGKSVSEGPRESEAQERRRTRNMMTLVGLTPFEPTRNFLMSLTAMSSRSVMNSLRPICSRTCAACCIPAAIEGGTSPSLPAAGVPKPVGCVTSAPRMSVLPGTKPGRSPWAIVELTPPSLALSLRQTLPQYWSTPRSLNAFLTVRGHGVSA